MKNVAFHDFVDYKIDNEIDMGVEFSLPLQPPYLCLRLTKLKAMLASASRKLPTRTVPLSKEQRIISQPYK